MKICSAMASDKMKWLSLILVVSSIHCCHGNGYPLDCQVERFLLALPPFITAEDLNEVGMLGNAVSVEPDCTVPHLQFTWKSPGGRPDIFQPLFSCTWNSREVTSDLALWYLPSAGNYRERTIEDQSTELPFGSQCTFGGCYHSGDFEHKIYWIEPVNCTIDVNECSTPELNNCGNNSTCVNTIGSFECVCPPGYTWNETHCLDVDECSSGIDLCSEIASCENTDGGYKCFCPSGFTGNGSTCTNIDECNMPVSPCGLDPKVTCTDTEGSFTCECPTGYEWNEIYCQASKRCYEGICGPHADCVELDNGYRCICHNGYSSDDPNGHGNCTNIDDGYTCTCPSSFLGDGTNCDLSLLFKVLVVSVGLILLAAIFVLGFCCVILCGRIRSKATKTRKVSFSSNSDASLLSDIVPALKK